MANIQIMTAIAIVIRVARCPPPVPTAWKIELKIHQFKINLPSLTVHVELPEGITNGEKPVARERREREDRHANRHVLDELGARAKQAAPRPGVQCVDDRCERNGGDDQQQISQC
jgi:hypothetical protein